mgnify:CR=1 FL=1|tara:strand:- start:1768 stop:2031 length:264 start_codon:yes stop_codon:yes gene_type:complete
MDLGNNPTFADLVNYVIELISLLFPVIFGLIVIVLIWRLIDAWVINAGNDAKVEEGKRTAFIGVVVLVILSAVWGILELLRSSLFGL